MRVVHVEGAAQNSCVSVMDLAGNELASARLVDVSIVPNITSACEKGETAAREQFGLVPAENAVRLCKAAMKRDRDKKLGVERNLPGLEENLKSMKDLTADLMASFEAMRKSEALLRDELQDARRALAACQEQRQAESARADTATARVKELEALLRELEGKVVTLNTRALEAAKSAAEQQKVVAAEMEDRDRQIGALKAALREVKRLAAEERQKAKVDAQELAEENAEKLERAASRCAELEAAEDAARARRDQAETAQTALAAELGGADAARAAAEAEAARASAAAGAGAEDEARQRAAAAEALAYLRAENEGLHKELVDARAIGKVASEGAEAEIRKLKTEVAELKAALAKLAKDEAGMRQGADAEAAKLREQLAAAEAAQQEERAKAKALAAQLETASQQAIETSKRAKSQAKEMREQLDDAAQSSVRLCVVAPTVNVTFGEQVLSYKAPLPKEKIRSTLELKVLPDFAKSFIQEREGVAPDGTSMDDWLKEMTGTMQGSIEKHLLKVFRDGAGQ